MSKTELSKHLLQMKFMQRTALRVQTGETQDERQHLIDDEHWVLDVPSLKAKESKFHIEGSYVPCEELGFGRMSFKGFNPEIERLHKHLTTEEELARSEAREQESAVNDEEMAHRYKSLVGTIAKKFAAKRKNKAKMEESDEDTKETIGMEKRKRVQTKNSVTKQEDTVNKDSEPGELVKQENKTKKKKGKFLKPQDD